MTISAKDQFDYEKKWWEYEIKAFLTERASERLAEFYIFEARADERLGVTAKLTDFLSTIDKNIEQLELPLPFICQCMFIRQHTSMFQIYIDATMKKQVVVLESANDHSNFNAIVQTFRMHNFSIYYSVSNYKKDDGKLISLQNDMLSCKCFALYFMWKARNINLCTYIAGQAFTECNSLLQEQLESYFIVKPSLDNVKAFDINLLPNNFFKVAQSIKILTQRYSPAQLEEFSQKATIKEIDGSTYNRYLEDCFEKKMREARKNFAARYKNYLPEYCGGALNPEIEAYTVKDKAKVSQIKEWSDNDPATYLTLLYDRTMPKDERIDRNVKKLKL